MSMQYVNFVLNGEGHGPIGERLAAPNPHGVRFDPGLSQPYIDEEDPRQRAYVDINTGRLKFNSELRRYEPVYETVRVTDLPDLGAQMPVVNANTLRKGEWIQMQEGVVKATRTRLTAWADLMATSQVSGFDGMAKETYEYEAMSDPGSAVKDMDMLSEERNDGPLFNLTSVPLPITHAGFFFSSRRLAASRASGMPLNTTMAEACGRRIAEMVEDTLIGNITGITAGTQSAGYGTHRGTSTEYGYLTFPYRVTKTDLNAPTGSNPEAVKQDLIEMRETMYANGYFGPFRVYYSTGYDAYLDDDYFRSGSTAIQRTTRERILAIDGITSLRRLDRLTTGNRLIMVQMTSDVVQAINGMDITTFQYETRGGAQQNYRIAVIWVPLLKAPYNGVAGIIDATS
jgi:hypothetical protein